MSDFSNALESFGATQGSAQSYVASKRDKFFKDYKDRLTKTAQAQAEALGLDQEKQEKLSNTIETIGIQAPIIGAAGKKIYTYFANRGATVSASAPTTAPASVTSDVADTSGTTAASSASSSTGDDAADDAVDEASESPEAVLFGSGGQGADSSGDAADASADAGDEAGGDATELAGDSPEAVLFGNDASAVSGSVVSGAGGSMPSVLQGGGLANTSGGFMGGSSAASTAASTTAATEGGGTAAAAATGAVEGGSTAASTAAAASSGASEASGLSSIASATGSAETATGGSASELILPLAGLAVVGYSLYDLFKPHHSTEETAPPETFLTGHATGISDAVTRGRFASAGLDSVTSLPAQNSAF